MAQEARLVGLSGEYGGNVYPLTTDELLIGRGEDCGLQIVDSRISRNHAQLCLDAGGWVVEDLGSTHGTFVKGERVEKAVLAHGDTITIGETILRFEDPSSQDSVPTEMVSPDDTPTILEPPDATPLESPSPDDVATVMASPDDRPIILENPESPPIETPSPDDVATVMASPDDQPTQLVSADDQETVLADEHGEPAEKGGAGPDPSPVPAQPPSTPPPVPPPSEKRPFPWKWVAIGGSALVALVVIGLGLTYLGRVLGDQDQSGTVPELPSEVEPISPADQTMEEAPLIPPTLTPTPEILTTEGGQETPEPTAEALEATSPEPSLLEPVIGGAAQVAFASDRGGRPQIYLLDMATLEERALTDASGGACQPAWSGDGSVLAYTSPCNTNREEYSGSSIYLLEVDAEGNPGSTTQLITTVGGGDYDPAWSRDGSRIAFTSWRTGRPQIFSVNPDGSDLRNLNDDLAYNWAPTWSGDGIQVAFLTGRSGQEEIWTVPSGGGEEQRFSRSDGKDVARPDWSPDGSVIVFEKIVGNIPRIIAAPVADGGVRELQVCQEGQLSLQPMGEPTWSPDGSWLAFETWPDGVNHEIALMRANCTEYRLLTTDAGLDFDAAWRPVP